MELKDNPLLQPEDFRAPYNEKIQALKNNPETIAFDKLCYELFEGSEMGKKFIDEVKQRFLIPAMADRNMPNYRNMIIWSDGFKDFARMLLQFVNNHKQRIQAEGK